MGRRSGVIPERWRSREEYAQRLSTFSSIPDLSKKLVHRHRFAEATAALAAHREAEAGRETTRRFVLPLLDVRGHALDAGTTPEVSDRHAHRLRRDSLVAPVLPHPPACFDFVGRDSLDAIARETQLSGTEEAVVPEVPDCPWAESVLSPLQFSGADVTQCIVRVPRRSCVVGFVRRGKRRQDQPCRSESHRLLRRVSYRASLHASHYCPNARGAFGNSMSFSPGGSVRLLAQTRSAAADSIANVVP